MDQLKSVLEESKQKKETSHARRKEIDRKIKEYINYFKTNTSFCSCAPVSKDMETMMIQFEKFVRDTADERKRMGLMEEIVLRSGLTSYGNSACGMYAWGEDLYIKRMSSNNDGKLSYIDIRIPVKYVKFTSEEIYKMVQMVALIILKNRVKKYNSIECMLEDNNRFKISKCRKVMLEQADLNYDWSKIGLKKHKRWGIWWEGEFVITDIHKLMDGLEATREMSDDEKRQKQPESVCDEKHEYCKNNPDDPKCALLVEEEKLKHAFPEISEQEEGVPETENLA